MAEKKKVPPDERLKKLPSEQAAVEVGKRQPIYGHPGDVYRKVAIIWTGILTDKLTAPIEHYEVGLMMAGLKIGREANTPGTTPDNLIDLCGYADVVQMIYDREPTEDV